MAVVDASALIVPWTGTNPRGQTFLRGKGRCVRADCGNDLLRRVHSKTGHFRQPFYSILMPAEQSGDLLVQLADLLLEELQLLQRHLEEPTVHGLEIRARAERITQLFRSGAQLLIGQSRQSCRI